LRGDELSINQRVWGNRSVTYLASRLKSGDGCRHLAHSVFNEAPLVCRRNVFRGTRRSLTEEKLLHLLHDDFLILLARRVQAIFIEQHLAVFHPLAPSLL